MNNCQKFKSCLSEYIDESIEYGIFVEGSRISSNQRQDDDDENLKLAVYNEHFGNNTISYP